MARLQPGATRPIDDRWLTALTWEALLTFFLMLVIIAVATDFRAVGGMAGLAIGGTVCFEALFAGPLCGASMNPARSLGPAALSGEWSHFSAYVLGRWWARWPALSFTNLYAVIPAKTGRSKAAVDTTRQAPGYLVVGDSIAKLHGPPTPTAVRSAGHSVRKPVSAGSGPHVRSSIRLNPAPCV